MCVVGEGGVWWVRGRGMGHRVALPPHWLN